MCKRTRSVEMCQYCGRHHEVCSPCDVPVPLYLQSVTSWALPAGVYGDVPAAAIPDDTACWPEAWEEKVTALLADIAAYHATLEEP